MHAFVSESAISHQWKQFLICDAENVFSILFQAQCDMKHRHPDNIGAKCNIQNIILRPFMFNRRWVTKTKSDECCFIIVDLCEVAYFVQTHIMKHAWKDKKNNWLYCVFLTLKCVQTNWGSLLFLVFRRTQKQGAYASGSIVNRRLRIRQKVRLALSCLRHFEMNYWRKYVALTKGCDPFFW